jgi:hypothetical protein
MKEINPGEIPEKIERPFLAGGIEVGQSWTPIHRPSPLSTLPTAR